MMLLGLNHPNWTGFCLSFAFFFFLMLSSGDVIASWRRSCLRDAPFISFRWILTIFIPGVFL